MRERSSASVLALLALCASLGACGTLVRSATWDGDPIDAMMVLRDGEACTIVIDGHTMEGRKDLREPVEKYEFPLGSYLVVPECRVSGGRETWMNMIVSRRLWLGSDELTVLPALGENVTGTLSLFEERGSLLGFHSNLRRLGSSLFCGVYYEFVGGTVVVNAGVNSDVHVALGEVVRRCSATFFDDAKLSLKDMSDQQKADERRERQRLEAQERLDRLQEAGILPIERKEP